MPTDIELRPAGTPTGVVGVALAPESGKAYSVYLMSLGATKVFLDTTASDAAVAAVSAINDAQPSAAQPTVAAPDAAAATPVVLAQTGRSTPRTPLDIGIILVGFAATLSIAGGALLRYRAAR